ncbi:ribosomal protein mRpS25-like [Tropilaelaps mercedesae]|uniref:Small ribosomal subunit protein mS25 n=1 Tax=Tropilaelaps mercedesae TaxID=418985 RepID=A0A1V9X008_9ACAR|nr:ribosomal protein mRpS25-like [Tropilaelaps mercedesae]
MPFMRGAAPIRRTLKFLEKGRLVFRDRVKVVSLNFNTLGYRKEAHQGMRDFVFWDLHQVQYKNPSVQIVLLKNMTPSPHIRVWLDDGSEVIFDVDGQTSSQILERLIKTLGKTQEVLQQETLLQEKQDTPANFGRQYGKWCICEVEGQVPCPGIVKLPEVLIAKIQHKKGLFVKKEEE